MGDSRIQVIAEAGVNHNGSLETALALVDAAADAGADAVKFQTFNAAALASALAPKAGYQTRTTGDGESQLDMLRRLELDRAAHHQLAARCRERGIEFLSSPFDLASLSFLVEELRVARLKLGSGELTNGPMLLAAARSGLPLILSTGMGTLAEIEAALGVLALGYTQRDATPSRETVTRALGEPEARACLARNVTLLHCTTEYPAPVADVNLRAMDTIRAAFGLPIGYSDHTDGLVASIAAAARGATVIEKHFTLDRGLPGPDHRASIEPATLAELVAAVRQVEALLGGPWKLPSPSEQANLAVARKSLCALAPIRQGERFTTANLGVKRPGTGVSPMAYWEWLGRSASRDFGADEVITP